MPLEAELSRRASTLDGTGGRTPFNVRAHTGYASSGPSTSLLGFADGKTARGEFIQVCAECLSPCFPIGEMPPTMPFIYPHHVFR